MITAEIIVKGLNEYIHEKDNEVGIFILQHSIEPHSIKAYKIIKYILWFYDKKTHNKYRVHTIQLACRIVDDKTQELALNTANSTFMKHITKILLETNIIKDILDGNYNGE
jgi:hypothetical protein